MAYAARALRISGVWGNEPIVVVVSIGKVEAGLLRGDAIGVGRASEVGWRDGREGVAHVGTVGARVRLARGDGASGGGQCAGRCDLTLGERGGEGDDLGDLLVGEGEPADRLRAQVVLALEGVGHVEQRGGGGHGDRGAQLLRPS